MESLESRYLFKGRLVLDTAMHIGGGRASLAPTDAPVIRTPEGRPFIPGASFKGVFRSTVEKLAASIPGVRTCALDPGADCVGPQGKKQKEFNERREEEKWDDRQLKTYLEKELCDTCLLFGSPYMASKVFFSDLYLIEREAYIQIRDGVGIDRDSEKAMDHLKFDYETVSSGVSFAFRAMLENPKEKEIALFCAGLMEYISGFAGIGGKRSAGLGRCHLEDVEIYCLDLRDNKQRLENLRKYLLGRNEEEKMHRVADVEKFIKDRISLLLPKEGGR